jgi:hypothetical protein
MGDDARGRCAEWGGRRVAAIDGDVEAGLVELLFHIDLAGGLKRQQPGAHPGKLREGHAFFADVDGGAGEVRGGDIAVGGGGVAVHLEESALELDGTDGGVDLKRVVEARVVAAREVSEEVGSPRAAVAAVGGQIGIDAQRIAGGDGDDVSAGLKLVELDVVFDADQAFGFVALVLTHEGFERAAHGRDKADAAEGSDGSMGGRRLRGENGRASVDPSNRNGSRADAGDPSSAVVAGNCSRGGKDCVGCVAGDLAAGGSSWAGEMRVAAMRRRSRVRGGGKHRQRQQEAGRESEGKADAHRSSGVVNKSNTRVPDPVAREKWRDYRQATGKRVGWLEALTVLEDRGSRSSIFIFSGRGREYNSWQTRERRESAFIYFPEDLHGRRYRST